MIGRWLRRAAAVVLAGLAVGVVVGAEPASAHPLGNFTVNQSAELLVGADEVRINHVVDLAELPAYQTRDSEVDTDRNRVVSPAERDAYGVKGCDLVARTTRLSVAGRAVAVTVTKAAVTFPPGQGGLDTMRLECALSGAAAVERQTDITYRGEAYPDRIGWREVTALGDGTTLHSSDVPETSTSKRLTAYPDDLLSSPPNVRAATLTVTPGGPRAGGDAATSQPLAAGRGVDGLTRAFTDLIGRPQLSLAFGILAVLISVVLGAAHAVAPGHGKTVMAAFLVGERGSFRQAGVVALTVTVTHTAGVLVLGIVLTTSVVLAPQRLYAWLGLLSGLLLAGVGGTLLRRAWRSRLGVGAGHTHDHSRSHSHGHGHSHDGHGHHHHHVPATLSVRSLIAMGFAGGLVPSPSALVVLLGAVALGRTWFGVLLVLGYGVGMAFTLTSVGFALAKWRTAIERRTAGRFAGILKRAVPVATASLIVLVGLGLASQAAVALGTA